MIAISWLSNYASTFQRLNAQDERDWMAILGDKCRNATDAELNSVMDSMCDSWSAGSKRPMVRDFVNAIWANRKASKSQSASQIALSEFEEAEKHRVWVLMQEIFDWLKYVNVEGQKAWDQIWIRINDKQNSKAQKEKLYTVAAAVGFDRSLLSWKYRAQNVADDGL